VEGVVAKSIVCKPLKVRRCNRTTEWTTRSETNVIRQDQKHIWSPLRRFDAFREIWLRVFSCASDRTLKWRRRLGQHHILSRRTDTDYAKSERQYADAGPVSRANLSHKISFPLAG
jgi:hypothetical protein